jgi:hypothetical protein
MGRVSYVSWEEIALHISAIEASLYIDYLKKKSGKVACTFYDGLVVMQIIRIYFLMKYCNYNINHIHILGEVLVCSMVKLMKDASTQQ